MNFGFNLTLCANYFAKCTTNLFRNMNAIGMFNYLQWDYGTNIIRFTVYLWFSNGNSSPINSLMKCKGAGSKNPPPPKRPSIILKHFQKLFLWFSLVLCRLCSTEQGPPMFGSWEYLHIVGPYGIQEKAKVKMFTHQLTLMIGSPKVNGFNGEHMKKCPPYRLLHWSLVHTRP